MNLLKQTLYLNYAEEKGDKQVIKSYAFETNINVEEATLKAIATELSKLLSKTIDNITVNTKKTI